MQGNVIVVVTIIIVFTLLTVIVAAGLLYIESCIVYLRLARVARDARETSGEDVHAYNLPDEESGHRV